MLLTVHQRVLLANVCEELITLLQTHESFLQSYPEKQNKRQLSIEDRMKFVRLMLQVQQLYFRIIPIQQYMENYPQDFHSDVIIESGQSSLPSTPSPSRAPWYKDENNDGLPHIEEDSTPQFSTQIILERGDASWIEEENRIEYIYKQVCKRYFADHLLTPALDTLRLFNHFGEEVKSFQCDKAYRKTEHMHGSGLSSPRPTEPPPPILTAELLAGHTDFLSSPETAHALVQISVIQGTYQRGATLATLLAENKIARRKKPSPRTVSMDAIELNKYIKATDTNYQTVYVFSHLNAQGRDIDEIIATQLSHYAKTQYEAIVQLNKPIDHWLKCVCEATENTRKTLLKDVFDPMKLKQDEVDNITKVVIQLGLMACLGPIMGTAAGSLVDPLFNILKKIGQSALTSNPVTLSSEERAVQNMLQLNSFAQFLLQTDGEVPDPLSAIREYLTNDEPDEALGLMKKYVEYRLEGEAYAWSTLFDNPDKPAALWNGCTPKDIIRYTRQRIMERHKYNTKDTSWINDYATKQGHYKTIYAIAKTETVRELKAVIDLLFNKAKEQYATATGLENISNFIRKQTFNDSKTGLSSFNKNNYKILINTIGNEIELSTLVQYAVDNIGYWRGRNPLPRNNTDSDEKCAIRPTRDGVYAVARGRNTNFINCHIFTRYARWMAMKPDPVNNPFLDFSVIDDILCQFGGHRYTDQQNYRFNIVTSIIQDYVNTEMDARLLTAVQHHKLLHSTPADRPKIQKVAHPSQDRKLKRAHTHDLEMESLPAHPQHNSISGRIDQQHNWYSEDALRQHRAHCLGPLITVCQLNTNILIMTKTFYYEHLASPVQVLKHAHTTQFNMARNNLNPFSSPFKRAREKSHGKSPPTSSIKPPQSLDARASAAASSSSSSSSSAASASTVARKLIQPPQ